MGDCFVVKSKVAGKEEKKGRQRKRKRSKKERKHTRNKFPFMALVTDEFLYHTAY